MSASDQGNQALITLNTSGLNAINTASGLLAFGGAITTLQYAPGVDEKLFLGSTFNTLSPRRLILTTSDAAQTPEPGTAAIAAGALVLLALARRRRL